MDLGVLYLVMCIILNLHLHRTVISIEVVYHYLAMV